MGSRPKGRVSREYPDRPVVGVGGVVIDNGRALLVRRGCEPLIGQWSIPGGMLELNETIQVGVMRELLEETGLEVRVVELIEVFERIFHPQSPGNTLAASAPAASPGIPGSPSTGEISTSARPQYHFVILDYLCERLGGEARAGSDVTDVAFATEDELPRFQLTEAATRVLRKAFAMSRSKNR
ncbi:MAG TPA: NUDIX domain-containing protein [Candidatus Dormibacteraeota bacterium]|nr:NUDIX domain-containing protein [Candidatus Dormibacteraeota bacterium]